MLLKTLYLSLWCCGIACFGQCGSQGVHNCILDYTLPELLFCLPPPPPLFSLEVTNLPVVVVYQFFSWYFSVLCNITFASCFWNSCLSGVLPSIFNSLKLSLLMTVNVTVNVVINLCAIHMEVFPPGKTATTICRT